MKNKTTEFIAGLIFGAVISFTVWACSINPLGAGDYMPGEVRWKPMYVVIVEE
jgi:hypothetical protein